MTVIPIGKDKDYNVYIGNDLIEKIGSLSLDVARGKKAALVCDSNVLELYADKIKKVLTSSGYDVYIFSFPAGEKSKNLETYTDILTFLSNNSFSRSDTVFALGGGVTGDMAGFAASTYMRGIKFVNIATTLLSMVDSSVGGKTGVDLPTGKNLVGTFYRPSAVFCPLETLNTLSEDIFNDGMAEVIKYGIIGNEILSFCEDKKTIKDNIEDIISKCVSIKNNVVSVDENESGPRRILNFGHTLAHSVEKLSDYNISHGKAVGFGIAAITRASVKKGLCESSFYKRIEKILAEYNLPLYTEFTPDQIYKASLSDKKFSGDEITVLMTRGEGQILFNKVDKKTLYDIILNAEVNNKK